jgi:transposase-like protein
MAHTRISREKRLEQVRRWQASGLSAAEFGRKHGIPAGTLGWWQWKLRSEGMPLRRRPQRLPAFVEIPAISVNPAPPARERLELELADVTLRIPADFDDKTLSRVLGVLRSAR